MLLISRAVLINKLVEVVLFSSVVSSISKLITWYKKCSCEAQSITNMEKIKNPRKIDMDKHVQELEAIMFGCERINMYTYGADIDVMTDHKPLESNFEKPLHKVLPCLQRMRLRYQKYYVKVR